MEDIIIKNGRIVDGTGKTAYMGGVAITNGKLTAVGDVSHLTAKKTIDAKKKVISPGLIDAHCHSDISFLLDDRSESRIYQGVTSEVCGQCGDSYYPCMPERIANISTKLYLKCDEEWADVSFDGFLRHAAREKKRMATNLCQLVGHSTLRAGVMDYEDRAPTAKELERMQRFLDADLSRGAWGLSLGLEYTPGCFAHADEFNALAEVVKTHDGLVTAHMRSEGDYLREAIAEIISIGKAAGVRVHISHLKIDRPVNWGKAAEFWRMIEEARASGVAISADMYPYNASCTGITNRCPKWAIEGGVESAAKFLKGPRREEILEHLRGRFPDREWAKRCLITTTYGLFPEADGKSLLEIAEMLNLPYAEAAAELIERSNGNALCIFFTMDEQDVDYFLRQDIGICSDGYGLPLDPALLGSERPHPRSYGSLTRFLRLARETGICTLEEAVRRVTSKAADMIKLPDRGRLIPGLAADVTVFDPDTVSDTATYLNPFQKPVGVDTVIVNGEIALENGVQTAARAGKFLMHE